MAANLRASLTSRTAFSGQRPSRRLSIRAQSGRAEPFNEGAAQVKRLISRDRKEFLGNEDDILDKYNTEFDATPSTSDPTPSAKQANPFGSASPSANPFGSAPTSSNPFGSAPAAQPFKPQRSMMEPAGLRPDMSPDPVQQEKAFNLFENITLTQVVIVLSFTLIIALMISTAYFVYSVGGIRLNGM